MGWSWLADLVLLFHAAYVAYVVFGLVAIVVGIALGWRWVTNFHFRITHLFAILLVVAESLLGATCPLTTLENSLRQVAGERGYPAGFIAHWVQPLIFFDFPQWVFMAGYIGFGLLVCAVFVLAPPHLPRRAGAGSMPASRS
jgi:Protein of Unknown function (DUF2784)